MKSKDPLRSCRSVGIFKYPTFKNITYYILKDNVLLELLSVCSEQAPKRLNSCDEIFKDHSVYLDLESTVC